MLSICAIICTQQKKEQAAHNTTKIGSDKYARNSTTSLKIIY